MSADTSRVSAERYLAGSVILSVLIALVLSRAPSVAFGSFVRMATVLVAADLVVYAFTKVTGRG